MEMNQNIRQLISIGLLCISMSIGSFATAETSDESITRNLTAQVYEGQVRINTLSFENTQVKEPILLYQGSYYLPMTPDVMSNLGIKSGVSASGNIGFELSVPTIDGTLQLLPTTDPSESRVDVLIYQKEMMIDDVVIHPEDAFHPVLVYNNTFYIPLNGSIIEEGFELELGFNRDRVLMIKRNLDKMIRGTVDVIPESKRVQYINGLEERLMASKPEIVASGTRYDFDDQVLYFLENETEELTYVEFHAGDWLVSSTPAEGPGSIVYFYAEDAYRYVGEYVDGRFEGIGRLRDSNGNVQAIKPFEQVPVDVPYSQRLITYNEHSPVLMVLVEFTDERIIGTDAQWYDKLFGEDLNSLRSYYKEITNNQLQLIPAIESYGDVNDGIVKVKLDQLHPNTGDVIGKTEELSRLIADQIETHVNMKLYDRNDNGVIDRNELTVIGVLAGYESSKATPSDYPQLRSHHLFSDISLSVIDEIGVMNMIYISELEYYSNQTELSTNAVFAHELGHQLGLPDLYDVDGSSKGLGPFSLMAEGTNNYVYKKRPGEVIAYMDPWSLIQIDAVTPEIVTEPGTYEIRSRESGDYNVIRIDTNNPNEYFLLENRTLTDRDLSLKASVKQSGGILIYHVDTEVIDAGYQENVINADELRKGIDIEEASEKTSTSALDNSDYSQRFTPFFTAKGNAIFNDSIVPRSRSNDGSNSGITVEVISDGPISKVMITLE